MPSVQQTESAAKSRRHRHGVSARLGEIQAALDALLDKVDVLAELAEQREQQQSNGDGAH